MATYEQLTEWAGLGHVTRAGRGDVAGWRIPGFAKAQLIEVGIPLAPRLIERVVIRARLIRSCSRPRGPLYRLTEQVDPDEQTEGVIVRRRARNRGGLLRHAGWGGVVRQRRVRLWFDVLHRYGSRVTASELLSEPDGPEEYLSEEEEVRAFAERTGWQRN